MKSNVIQDERVTAQKRKITSEAFSMVMIFLISSALVKQFIFKAPFSEYAVEFIAFFGASFYIVIRNIFVGNDPFGEDNKQKKKIMIMNIIVIGVTITAVNAFLHFREQQSSSDIFINLAGAFIISTLAAFIVFFGLNTLTKRRIKKLEKQFDDEIEE